MKGITSLYLRTRAHSVELSAPLHTEDYIPQPVDFVSPPKWHLAHITWFFEEMILKKHLPEYKIYDPSFSFLFNSYYQSIGERTLRNHRGLITRPGVEKVFDYRTYVDNAMTDLLEHHSSPEVENLVVLGIQHEQQHQELFITDLKYILHCNPIHPVYNAAYSLVNDYNTTEHKMIDIAEGVYSIGAEGNEFHFDNEYNRHKVYLQPFSISNTLVTNQEYIEFIEAGGYKDFNFWLDEGYSWVTSNNIDHPLYWHYIDGKWNQFTLSGLQPLEPDGILAHISYYEANAFAQWRGKRLPTEQEWEVAAEHFKWGQRWEWTNSAYLPYPGFSIAPGALGEYNGKFMINQMVLRGASNATANGHSRITYRNFFHPHYQWQLTGIRLAK